MDSNNLREVLRREFEGKAGSFIIRARCENIWDWDAFRRLTSAMYDVAIAERECDTVERWIAQGFWFCDTWVREYTSGSYFPRLDKEAYEEALQLLNDLAHFFFTGDSPFEDDSLEQLAKG